LGRLGLEQTWVFQ
jgi:hypothetical protein